jgi:predicted MFS family arabinose efflux permease
VKDRSGGKEAGVAGRGARDRSRYALGVLFLVYAFNHLDRQVFGALLEPIKTDLALSDTAMGFLGGLAFALFHAIAGVPIARWADRSSRTRIIALGVVIWSAATAASGLVRNLGQMTAARVMIGIGEASNGPASHSLISDYFPPQRRATALAVFFMGAHLGVLLGFAGGGFVAERLGWRVAFLMLGAPGVLLALLVWFTVPEPERGAADSGAIDTRALPFRSVVHLLGTNRTFLFVLLGQAIHAFSAMGLLLWMAPLLMRLHGMNIAEAGLWIGPIAGISGAVGVLAGGRLADRFGARDAAWYLRLPALAALIGVPFTVVFIMTDRTGLALLCLVPHAFLNGSYSGPVAAVVQSIVHVRSRAVAASLNVVATNLIGVGLGPQIIGVLSDVFSASAGERSLRWAMLLVALSNLLAAVFYLRASRDLRSSP